MKVLVSPFSFFAAFLPKHVLQRQLAAAEERNAARHDLKLRGVLRRDQESRKSSGSERASEEYGHSRSGMQERHDDRHKEREESQEIHACQIHSFLPSEVFAPSRQHG